MPTLERKILSYVVDRINGKIWSVVRGDGVIQNVEWIDPVSACELIVRTHTLPDVNINH